MPLQKLQFRPGVNREGTTLANEGGWFDGDKVRFRSGYPEKIGGWSLLSVNTFLGVCRSLWNWVTLKNYNLLGVGTNQKLYVENGGVYYDITPLRETNDNDPSGQITLSVTNGSSTLTIVDNNADLLQVNDFVTLAGATTLGGNVLPAVLNQQYPITSVISGTQYTVILRKAGTSINGTAFIVDPTTSTLRFPVGTVLTNNETVTPLATQSLPAGLILGVTYYVINVNGVTCQLSLTLGGPAVPITSTGVGQQALYFTLTSTVSATSSAMTALTIAYQINTGLSVFTIGTGWGAGPWSPYATISLTNPFATTSGSSTITVTQATHGLSNGQYVFFASISDTDVSGIPNTVLQKAFQVSNVTTNTYNISTVIGQAPGPVITYTANATSATQGGTVEVYYPSASIVASTTRGWGTGYTTGIGQQLRLWSQANFGDYLLSNPRGEGIYIWQPGLFSTPAFDTRSVVLSPASITPPGWDSTVTDANCPSVCNQVLVSDITRIVIAFGCNNLVAPLGDGVFDPLLIRWSDIESYTSWTPQFGVSQAGGQRLSHGSQIIGAFQTRQEIVVFTDAAIYAMQYIGPPETYGFTLLADNISLVSPNAIATAAGVVYWMGTDKFYAYSGRVETLPCAVRQYVFSSINRDQDAQFFAGTNEGYSEVWWFYCSIEGADGTGTIESPNTVIDRYVIFNYLDRVWYYGTMSRTAWVDSPLRQFPQAATTDNYVVFHESSVNDEYVELSTAQERPIDAYIQSSDFDIGDGHNYGFVWRIIPDITFDGSDSAQPEVTFTLRPRRNPGANYGVANSPDVISADSYVNRQSYNVQRFTEIVYTRLRGRQMAFKIESNTLGTQWQLGTPRMDVRPDGRR